MQQVHKSTVTGSSALLSQDIEILSISGDHLTQVRASADVDCFFRHTRTRRLETNKHNSDLSIKACGSRAQPYTRTNG